MSRTKIVRLLAGVVGVLLAVGVGGAASQAHDSAQLDAERVVHPHLGRTIAATPPAFIDSDIYVSATSRHDKTYFVVAGHLRLKLRSGSTTRYAGHLIDYRGNVARTAAANISDPAAPILVFSSAVGAFRFTADNFFGGAFYTGTGVTVPKALGKPANQISFGAATHNTTSVSYNFVLTERVGAVQAHFEYTGSITFVRDANGRIAGGQVSTEDSKGRQVTHPLLGSGYSSTGYFYATARLDKQLFGITGTFSGTSFSGFGFTGAEKTLSLGS